MIVSDSGGQFTSNAILQWADWAKGRLALYRVWQADPEHLHRKVHVLVTVVAVGLHPSSREGANDSIKPWFVSACTLRSNGRTLSVWQWGSHFQCSFTEATGPEKVKLQRSSPSDHINSALRIGDLQRLRRKNMGMRRPFGAPRSQKGIILRLLPAALTCGRCQSDFAT
jgi:hypothetical protein